MSDVQGCKIAVVGDEEVCGTIRRALQSSGCVSVPVEEASVVFAYEPTQSGQEELYLGEQGLLKRVAAGTTLVELAPSIPSFAHEVYQLASVYGCQAVAAPLVVIDPVAADAFGQPSNLLAVCGGERAAVDAVTPLVRSLASRVLVMGSVAEAQAMKAAHSVDAAAGIAGAIEALGSLSVLAPDADREDLVDVLVQSGALSPAHEAVAQAVLDDSLQGTYTASLLMADLAMAFSALEESDSIMPQADAAFHLLELLAVTGGGNLNPAALSLMFGDEAATERYGLDWSRAAACYGDADGHGHDHDHDHGCDHDDGCTCGHDHGHGALDDGWDDELDPDGMGVFGRRGGFDAFDDEDEGDGDTVFGFSAN